MYASNLQRSMPLPLQVLGLKVYADIPCSSKPYKLHLNFLFMYLFIFIWILCLNIVLGEEEGTGSLGAGVPDNGEQPCGTESSQCSQPLNCLPALDNNS